jgi:hypothetical protein
MEMWTSELYEFLSRGGLVSNGGAGSTTDMAGQLAVIGIFQLGIIPLDLIGLVVSLRMMVTTVR